MLLHANGKHTMAMRKDTQMRSRKGNARLEKRGADSDTPVMRKNTNRNAAIASMGKLRSNTHHPPHSLGSISNSSVVYSTIQTNMVGRISMSISTTAKIFGMNVRVCS